MICFIAPTTCHIGAHRRQEATTMWHTNCPLAWRWPLPSKSRQAFRHLPSKICRCVHLSSFVLMLSCFLSIFFSIYCHGCPSFLIHTAFVLAASEQTFRSAEESSSHSRIFHQPVSKREPVYEQSVVLVTFLHNLFATYSSVHSICIWLYIVSLVPGIFSLFPHAVHLLKNKMFMYSICRRRCVVRWRRAIRMQVYHLIW